MRRIFILPVLAVVCIGLVALSGTLPGQSGTSTGGQARPQGPSSTLPVSSDTASTTRSYPAGSSQAQIAALREDIRGLSAMVREQNLVIEELQRRHRATEERLREYDVALREARNQSSGNYATMNQVNRALEELNENVRQASRDQRREIIDQVSRQIDELARETQRAMDTLARNISTSRAPAPAQAQEPGPQASFSDNYPSEGISYTVQSGDTLSGIATRFNSRVADIRNANRIEDPNRLRVGQTLFIPQRD